MNRFRIHKPILAIALTVVSCAIVLTSTSFASATFDSDAFLDQNLRGGLPQVGAWEANCKDNMTQAGSITFPTLRAWINGAAGPASKPQWQWGSGYISDTWISSATRGNTVTPIDVMEGTTVLPLRVNSLRFLCRTLVNPDLGCTATGTSIAASEPWATATQGKDVPPNAVGSSCMKPAQTLEKSLYESISIVADTTGGGSLSYSSPLPYESKWTREEDSRYWFNNYYYFNYNSNAGFTTSGTLTIQVNAKHISGYHYPWNDEFNQTQTCENPAGGWITNRAAKSGWYIQYSQCQQFSDQWAVTINVLSYSLDPSATVSGGATVTANQNVTVTSSVNKTGTMTSGMKDENNLAGTSWWVDRFVYPAGSGIVPPATDTDNDVVPCSTPQFAGYSSCTRIGNYYQADGNLAAVQLYTNTLTDTIPNLPAGTKICYVTSVARPTHKASPIWRHSAMSCTVIAKSPYIVIANSDAAAGGGINPSCSTTTSGFRGRSATSFGSFGEYGLVPTGTVSNFGSAGYVGATAKQLTFANTPTLGTYRAEHCIWDQIAHYQPREAAATALSSASPIAVNSLNGDYKVSGDITLSGGTLSANQHALIYAPGTTVTITGDIKYNPIAYVSFRQVPQLIVVANRIVVNNNVRELAGSYFAAGTATSIFNTCSEAGDTPNSNQNAIKADGQCQNPVIVNGSVSTAKIVVPRTSGGTGPGLAAEIFHLRPEAFLTPYELGIDDSAIKTDILQERPARY